MKCQKTGGSAMPHSPVAVTGKPVQYAKAPATGTSKRAMETGNKKNR